MSLATVDPLYAHGLNLAVWVILLVRLVVAFAVLLTAVILMIWFERKAISDMQSRIGPQRWGPFGLLQTLADGIKLIFKEDLVPGRGRPSRSSSWRPSSSSSRRSSPSPSCPSAGR